MDPKDNLSEEELELILSGFFQDPEAQLPESDDEIVSFFRSLDVSTVPTPNVAKFERLVSEKLHRELNLKPAPTFGGVLEGFRRKPRPMLVANPRPVAARKGKGITPETREKMDKAKKQNRSK